MQLSQLTETINPVARLGPPVDPPISSVTADSRQAGEGSLFIAIPGEVQDGHDYITDAVSRGARAIIVERTCPDVDVPVIKVQDSRRALAQVASQFYADPAGALQLVGVTGSVGKTSTSLILKRILEEGEVSVGVIGSLGIFTGDSRRESLFTTPDALALQAALHEMRSHQIGRVVMEVSSHALAQERTHGLLFDAALFTNLLPLEHSDFHPTFDHYVRTKAKLLDQVRPDGVVVYNADDPNVCRLAQSWMGESISFGFHPSADVRAVQPRTGVDGSTFNVEVGGSVRSSARSSSITLDLPLLGMHNVGNTLAAVAAALPFGAELRAIQRAVRALRPFARRMEPLRFGEVRAIDDTVGHPYSIDRLFGCIEGLGCRSLILVAAIRGGRGTPINAANAQRYAHWYRRLPIRSVWITAGLDATMEKDRVTPEEERAFIDVLADANVPFEYTPFLAEACAGVATVVTPDDVVLLAGAQGMDAGSNFLRHALGV